MEKKKIEFSEKSNETLISAYSYFFLPIISKEYMSHSGVGDLTACTSSVKCYRQTES